MTQYNSNERSTEKNLVTIFILIGLDAAGNRPHLHRDARHPGGPADTPTPVREEHRQLQAKDRPAGGRPPAHPGSSHLRQQTHQLHHGGKTWSRTLNQSRDI